MPPPRSRQKGKEQRFYARNRPKTTLVAAFALIDAMFQPRLPIPDRRIHPLLTSFGDECCSVLARLIAYVSTLALVGMLGACLWHELQPHQSASPAIKLRWTLAERSHPAFAVSQFDSPGKTESYEIFRHREGGRKDILRWVGPGENPLAELEIYRPGNEFEQAGPDRAAGTADPQTIDELEPAGVIDSKFGSVTLFRPILEPDPCLRFLKRLDETRLQISGWSCQGDTLAARRAAIGCVLNRLVLLTAGNDPKLAEIFARAELKGGSCAAPATTAAASDWVTSAENPGLRGAI
jgi:hypothetical protein